MRAGGVRPVTYGSAVLFDTEIELTGPWRTPRQMLAEQTYDGHTSVHDDATAAKLGLRGAPIEGPTHFSQFDPLAVARWGTRWFTHGCISAHFQTMVVEGDEVRATLTTAGAGPGAGEHAGRISAVRNDGAVVLTGTASVGPDHPTSELDGRLARLGDPGELFIVDRVQLGHHHTVAEPVSMPWAESNGDFYPFSLQDKVAAITEPHPWYTPDGAASSPWGRPIVPMEMISVLAMKAGNDLPVRGPSVGLFLDLEVRLLDGPVFVDEPYRLEQDVVGLAQTRRVESHWLRTTLVEVATDRPVAVALLHSGVFKASYAGYPADRLA
jgi:hypothetical protein